MEIKLDKEAFAEAANEAVTRGITDAMEHWEVKSKLREAVVSVVGESNWADMVARAIGEIDEDAIIREVADEATKLLAYGMREVLVSSMASVLLNIETRGGYLSTEEQAQRLEKRAAQLREWARNDGAEGDE